MDSYQRAVLALDCLRLAQAADPGFSPQAVVDRARAYRDFLELSPLVKKLEDGDNAVVFGIDAGSVEGDFAVRVRGYEPRRAPDGSPMARREKDDGSDQPQSS